MNILLSAYKNAFENYFNVKGRCSKSGYWGFMLTNISIITLINILSILDSNSISLNIISVLYVIYSIGAVITISVRRLHDIGLSGKILWILPAIFIFILSAINIFGANMLPQIITIGGSALFGSIIYLLILLLQRGEDKDNEYGEKIEESSELNKLANIFAIIYIILNISNRVLVINHFVSKVKKQEQTSAQIIDEAQKDFINSNETQIEKPVIPTNINVE